jgi:hypothetical protein
MVSGVRIPTRSASQSAISTLSARELENRPHVRALSGRLAAAGQGTYESIGKNRWSTKGMSISLMAADNRAR